MEDSRNVQDEVESIGLRGDGSRCGRCLLYTSDAADELT